MQNSSRVPLLYRGLFVLALLVLPLVYRYDRELFYLLNCDKNHRASLQFFFLLLTSLADGLWVMMLLCVVQSLSPRNFKALLIALILGNLALHSAKYFIDADRPLKVLGTVQVCVLGMPLTVRSFPSGHAFSAGVVFMFLRPRQSWAKALVLLTLATLAAISRVYVGAHFPKDIVVGFLLAVVAFLIGESLAGKITFRATSLPLRKGLVALMGATTALIYIFAYPEKTAELEFLLTPAAWMVVLYWGIYAITRFLSRSKTNLMPQEAQQLAISHATPAVPRKRARGPAQAAKRKPQRRDDRKKRAPPKTRGKAKFRR